MAQLTALLNQVLAGGIGGITFLGAWSYLVFRWLSNADLGGGIGLKTLSIPIPWLW